MPLWSQSPSLQKGAPVIAVGHSDVLVLFGQLGSPSNPGAVKTTIDPCQHGGLREFIYFEDPL